MAVLVFLGLLCRINFFLLRALFCVLRSTTLGKISYIVELRKHKIKLMTL